jgi:WD40 repeat protein
MRRVLVDHARDRKRLKRGGGLLRLELLDQADSLVEDPDLILLELKEPAGEATCAAFSPDGARIATASSSLLKVWDAKTGKALRDWPASGTRRLAFSPDGSRIVTGGFDSPKNPGNEVKVWDARTAAQLLDLTQRHSAAGYLPAQVSVAFSPDGKRIIVAGARMKNSPGQTLTVRDAQTGAVLLEVQVKDIPMSVAFSPDGTRIATGNFFKTATAWDAQTGKVLLELKGHTGNAAGPRRVRSEPNRGFVFGPPRRIGVAGRNGSEYDAETIPAGGVAPW